MSASTGDTAAARTAPAWLVTRPLWVVGVAAVIAGGVAAELFGLAGRAIDVPMEAPAMGGDEAQSIYVGGFVVATVFYGIAGILIALALGRWSSRPAPTWLVITVIGTGLSLILPMTAQDTETATKVVLAISHIVAAAVIVPTVALRLSHDGGRAVAPTPSPAA